MPDALLSMAEVTRRVSLGRTTIYQRIREQTFPRPRDLGPGCVRWLESEIDSWIGSLPPTTLQTQRKRKRKNRAASN